MVAKDIEGLQNLDTMIPQLKEIFFEAYYKPKKSVYFRSSADIGDEPAAILSQALSVDGKVLRDYLPVKDLDFDYAEGAYSVYNWEVFYHIPFTCAVHLSKNQRFAEAQRWFHYIFDPTDNSDGPAPQRFWKVKPFQIDEVEHVEDTLLNLSTGDNPDLRERTVSAIAAWRDKPFRPHLVARTRPTAYMYATVMAYLDNLISWGDSLFQQDTRESINEALQYYVLCANILGPTPQAIPKKGTLKTQTYASLRNDLDEFGNAAKELEAEIPFDLLGSGLPTEGSSEDVTLESVGRSLYFCIPRNEKLLGYWDTVADRLFKIRNSLNLQGVFRQLPLFAPPIDPAVLARAVAAGVDVGSIIAGLDTPLAPVRFSILLQRAIELCQEVKALGPQILSAIEKKDNEELSILRAKHESELLSLMGSVKYGQWQEAKKNRESLEISLQNTFQRFRYYERLLGRNAAEIKLPEYVALNAGSLDQRSFGMTEPGLYAPEADVQIDSSFRDGGHKINPSEAHELDFMEAAQILQDAGTVLDGIGAVLNLIPDFAAHVQPLGVGATAMTGGTKLGHAFQGLAMVSRGIGGRVQHEANMAAKMASYDRREQDWAYQRQLAAGEVTLLYKNLRSAEIREYISEHEYSNHQKQLEQAKDIEDFLINEKRKTTNANFYLWMKREAQSLHAKYFQFAYDVAKKAEQRCQYELGDAKATFLTAGYLGGRESLFAGEKLYLDLKRMEIAYAELNVRDFEITKNISLRDWFPRQLLKLRTKGQCEISIPEALFDLDCPGHFFRRIKSVAVSIPCVTGPYASVNCSLTLSASQVRTKATAVNGEWYFADIDNPDTERFTRYSVATNSIVTSNAQNDAGLFEQNLRDERPLPFEGGGVISKWSIQLLGKPRQFNYDTVADVVLTVRYTARPGAPQEIVSNAVEAWLKANSTRLFSMRHEFSSEWARFKNIKLEPGQTGSFSFELRAHHFPYRMQESFSNAKSLHIFCRTDAQQVNTELIRDNTSVGKTTLMKGEGIIVPPPQGEEPGSFDPRGKFELRFDTTALDDIWVVVDWAGGSA
ncbi:hypothetical protein [Nitrosospira sp. Is2]|uniref:Tc toxin subunit A-related protein n=1 Tax=Nitrosospira sp. Is2 TaxID=3080532 RepID=UPI00295354C2|nr:hypothetical protein [Nitrosospira sp. Is2]WON73552.1 hypothetical protein R5L00_13890 [Nitrosospira sp. Is2]